MKKAQVFIVGGGIMNIIMIVLIFAILALAFIFFSLARSDVEQQFEAGAGEVLAKRVVLFFVNEEQKQSENKFGDAVVELSGTSGIGKIRESAIPLLDKEYCKDREACSWCFLNDNVQTCGGKVCNRPSTQEVTLLRYKEGSAKFRFVFGKC